MAELRARVHAVRGGVARAPARLPEDLPVRGGAQAHPDAARKVHDFLYSLLTTPEDFISHQRT